MNFGNLHSCVARVPAWTRVLTQVHRLSRSVRVVRAQSGAAGGGGAGAGAGEFEDGRAVGHHTMECATSDDCRLLYDWAMWARDGLVWRGWQRWWEARCCWRTGLPGLGGAGVGFWESGVMQCSFGRCPVLVETLECFGRSLESESNELYK